MNLRRIEREKKTISVMTGMYCRAFHGTKKSGLCPECSAIESYAMERIKLCPFIEDKPTCLKCPVHCYKPDKREQVRVIMRFAGPRMMTTHPVLAFFHVLDGFQSRKKHGKNPKT